MAAVAARPRSSEPISLHEAAERLGVHYMTAYRYVRTGLLPATKEGAVWHVDPAELERFQARDRPRRGPRSRAGYADRLADRLAVGDEAGSSELVENALAGGADLQEVYLDLLAPALVTIGDRWERGELTVANEHQASAVVLRLLGRLGTRFTPRGRRKGTIVLGAAPGEQHGLPTALLADLLRAQRWDVVDLGADVPVDGFADACAERDRLAAVGICVTVVDDQVPEAIAALRAAGHEVPVLLGGQGIRSGAHVEALGGDAYAPPGRAALTTFEEWARRGLEARFQ